MKIILRQAVPKLGKEGQVVNVKPGYARNFLFPQGMAVVADKKQLEVVERRNARLNEKLAEGLSAAESVRDKVTGKTVRIETKAGPDGRLFGAVTDQNIADAVKEQLGQEVDKKAVLMLRPIKRLGRYDIELDVHRNVSIDIKVVVFDPEFIELDEALPEEEAPVAEPVAVAAVEAAPVAEATEEPAEETVEESGE